MDIISNPSKKRRLCKYRHRKSFTIQHLIALEYAISSYKLPHSWPLSIIYSSIVTYVSSNIDFDFKFIQTRLKQFSNNHNNSQLNQFKISLKCTSCNYLMNEDGNFGGNDYLCKDCDKLFCGKKCFEDADHVLICNICDNRYCKTFHDDDYYSNKIRKCGNCAAFICMKCQNYDAYVQNVNLLCYQCDDNVEKTESEWYQTTYIDRRTILQRYDELQCNARGDLDDHDEMISDPLEDEGYDKIDYEDIKFGSRFTIAWRRFDRFGTT